MHFPNANDLYYLVTVAETQNISRAAERLGITQPSLSASIKRLETQLDCLLLIREKRGVRLTKEGSKLVQNSKSLLNQWEDISHSIHESQNTISGTYSLGCHVSVSLYTLKYFIPQLFNKHPNLNINLIHNHSGLITERVINGEIDLGLVVNPVSHPDLVIRDLGKDIVTTWTNKKKINNNVKTLIYDPELLQSQALVKELQKQKIVFTRYIRSKSLEVILDLVSYGAGIGILPSRVANNSIEKLSIAHPKLKGFNDRFCLIYRGDTVKTESFRALTDAIMDLKKVYL